MDQELKQRLIGAAVITALAAIFVPMLFDDPIDETGKNINQLTLPEIPAKSQEVEILPLPEKAEDVVPPVPAPAEETVKQAAIPTPVPVPMPRDDEGAAENDVEPPKPKLKLTGKERPPMAVKRLGSHEPAPAPIPVDEDMPAAEAEDAAPMVKPSKPGQPAVSIPAPPAPAPKISKPAAKASENIAPADNTAKPAVAETGTRWYLNAGSFTQKANAQALLDNLKQQGFAVTLKETAGEKGAVYKVRVGPMLDRVKAQAVKNKLTQININSFVSPDE